MTSLPLPGGSPGIDWGRKPSPLDALPLVCTIGLRSAGGEEVWSCLTQRACVLEWVRVGTSVCVCVCTCV